MLLLMVGLISLKNSLVLNGFIMQFHSLLDGSRPFLLWFSTVLCVALLLGLLVDGTLIMPVVFQTCLLYFFPVRPVLVWLGYADPLHLCKKIRRRQ